MTPDQAVEEVARSSYGRLVAYLASLTGDIAAAEDALGDALVAALATWPDRGVPARPDSWLLTAARRNLIDAARRRDTARRSVAEVARVIEENADRAAAGAIGDERLRLMFVCAHPAIAPPVRSALMLQTVLGLDAARISAAFLLPPTTLGQRLSRAKAKVKQAQIGFRLPERDEIPGRLGAVLEAIYAAYGTGWDDLDGQDAGRVGLEEEAIRLATLVTELLPGEPETHGLLALLLHSHARAEARTDGSGQFVPLSDQDVARWSRADIARAEHHLATAASSRQLGPFQLQAAIQSVHSLRAATGVTDWESISRLYDGLVALSPTIGAQVARAAAHREAHRATAALDLLDHVAEQRPQAVAAYQPYWVVRARCEIDLDDPAASRSAATALDLTTSPAVAAHLRHQFGVVLEAPCRAADGG